MSRHTLVLRLTAHLAAVSALILTMGAPAHAVPIMINNGSAPPNMINNGSAPPNPENVIDGADNYLNRPGFSGDSVTWDTPQEISAFWT